MDRLQKKCFLGSALGHGLLLVVFLTSSAFVSAPKPDPMPNLEVIQFIPLKTVDELIAPGGGYRDAAPLPDSGAPPAVVAPPVPEPEPPAPPPAVREPEPEPPAPKPEPPARKPVVREPTPKPPDERSLVPAAEKKKRVFELKRVVRNADTKTEAKKRAETQARERAAAVADERAARQAHDRLAREFANAANALGNLSSGGVAIRLHGPGGGGVPYANFWQAVMSAYDRAWQLPDGITDNGTTAMATVTIARDGTVVSARISQPSGNAALDASVRRALDRVKYAAPLPDSARENQRTITINFNVGAKRGLG